MQQTKFIQTLIVSTVFQSDPTPVTVPVYPELLYGQQTKFFHNCTEPINHSYIPLVPLKDT